DLRTGHSDAILGQHALQTVTTSGTRSRIGVAAKASARGAEDDRSAGEVSHYSVREGHSRNVDSRSVRGNRTGADQLQDLRDVARGSATCQHQTGASDDEHRNESQNPAEHVCSHLVQTLLSEIVFPTTALDNQVLRSGATLM